MRLVRRCCALLLVGGGSRLAAAAAGCCCCGEGAREGSHSGTGGGVAHQVELHTEQDGTGRGARHSIAQHSVVCQTSATCQSAGRHNAVP
jgi:hypothetical protein